MITPNSFGNIPNRVRIEADLRANSTRVTVGDTGQEIKGIRKVELHVEAGGVWMAVLHVFPCKVDIKALAEAKLIQMKPPTDDEPTVEITAVNDDVRRFVGIYSGAVTERPIDVE